MTTPIERERPRRAALTRVHLVLGFGLLALLVFALLRGALLVRAWGEIPHQSSTLLRIFAVGAFYDLAFLAHVLLALTLGAMLPQRLFGLRAVRATAFAGVFVFVYALFFVVVAEWLFWGEFDARFNFISVDYLIYRQEVTDNIRESYPMPWIFGGLGLVSLLVVWPLRRAIWRALGRAPGWRQRVAIVAVLLVGSVGSAALVDQSVRDHETNNYVKELASSGPYQFVAAFRNNTLDYARFYAIGDPEKLSALLAEQVLLPGETRLHPDRLFDLARNTHTGRPRLRANVILITVESLSAKYLVRYGGLGDLTPFLDTWISKCRAFDAFYATGTRTTRGLEAVTLSLPPTPGRSIVKRPDCTRYYNLGKVFADRGYDATFFYGGRGFFDNMNAFFRGCGYRVVDQSDFGSDEVTFANAWGVADGDLYRRALREADRDAADGKPFFFHIMTTSNHRPYTYPAGKVPIPSGTKRAGAVQYTDFALRSLIEAAHQRPWFANTLFVITADHCARSAGRVGLPVKRYHIPLLMFGAGIEAAGTITKRCSQIDLAPTILATLGIDYESHFFGANILDPGFRQRALIGNYQKLGDFEGTRLAILSPKRRIDLMQKVQGKWQITPADASVPLVVRTQAYYQGAASVIRTRLNRW